VKDENGDLLADSRNILNRWKNYFSQLLNVHNVSDVRQIEVHTDVLLAVLIGDRLIAVYNLSCINFSLMVRSSVVSLGTVL
jgi:hypothetical protein